MKKIILLGFSSLVALTASFGQVKIGDNPSSISPGSILELESTSKALALPRLTTVQMQAIPSPIQGMIVYNLDSNCIYLYRSNNAWASITSSASAGATTWPYQSNDRLVGVAGNAKGIVSVTGNGLVASGNYSHAEGLNSVASGTHSYSFGMADTATASGSMASGYQNKATGIYSTALGIQNISAYQSAVALGQENKDSGWASLAMGLRNSVSNAVGYSAALGYNNQVKGGYSNITLGEGNIINSGRANTALGIANTVSGDYNSLFGNHNTSLAGNTHVAGGLNNVVKSGSGNTVFGLSNTADGSYLAALGRENSVYFQSGVALGQTNKDSGWASITGGLSNTIQKNVQYGISFGYNNISSRNLSIVGSLPGAGTFTAGVSNLNSGYASMVLGANSRSTNMYSLAANSNSMANSHAMSAFGHFNDTIAAYQGESYAGQEMLFAIGNGNSSASRRNSFTMLRNGFTTINTSNTTGPNLPRAELDVKGTGAIIVPVGTSAQRPATPVAGMIRFCTDCGSTPVLQGYNGTAWVNL